MYSNTGSVGADFEWRFILSEEKIVAVVASHNILSAIDCPSNSGFTVAETLKNNNIVMDKS